MGAIAAEDINTNSSSTGAIGGGGGGGLGGGGENGEVERWTVCEPEGEEKKSDNERKEVRVKEDDCATVGETGCWIKLKFFGSCLSSRSKVDTSICGTSTNYGNSSCLGN